MGLSPRVRGNLYQRRLIVPFLGSIPARAGEPSGSRDGSGRPRVYPRACGGTNPIVAAITRSWGLSPRVRGNRNSLLLPVHHDGSIPARAGEPAASSRIGRHERVYPRACGGTAGLISLPLLGEGLSPRVRGNLPALPSLVPRPGSIPARAGEPSAPRRDRAGFRVYPRACGGTGDAVLFHRRVWGLSPRVRGNLVPCNSPATVCGSIPARAGEPWPCPCGSRVTVVYPRACGGTVSGAGMSLRDWGLSPRVRGNLVAAVQHHVGAGSIPARAGEPYRRS